MDKSQFEILIADDEEANIVFFEGVLVKNGYRVQTVSTGDEAFDLVKNQNFDLVLLDNIMPGLTGLEVLRCMKEDELFDKTKAIIVSSMTDANNIKEGLSLGAHDYIKKPVNEIELLARVNAVLNIKQKDDLLIEANEKLELQNKIIISNIESAQIIQKALLPQSIYYCNRIDDITVFSISKDIVNGDFYWFYENKTKLVVLESDCTGHGVYGAFLSLLGHVIIKSEVEQHIDHSNAADLLKKINTSFVSLLNSNFKNEDDFLFEGMDLSILIIDFEKNIVNLASASQDILYFDNEESLHRIHGDMYSIGYEDMAMSGKEITFTNVELDADSVKSVILMSDGFIDQFNKGLSEKYGINRFCKLVENNATKSSKEFNLILQDELIQWRKGSKQTDDITIIKIDL